MLNVVECREVWGCPYDKLPPSPLPLVPLLPGNIDPKDSLHSRSRLWRVASTSSHVPNAKLNATNPKVSKVPIVPILPKLPKLREGDDNTVEEKGTIIGISISLPDGMASVPTIGVEIDTYVTKGMNDGAALIADGFETRVLHAVEGGAYPVS